MATYGATRDKFKLRLNRRDCTDPLADGFLQDSVTRIQRVMDVPAGEKSVQVTIGDVTYLTNGNLPIPSDFIRLKDITVNGKKVLRKQPLQTVLTEVNYGVQGCSWCFTRQGGTWIFGPLPLPGDVVRIDYYSEFAPASVPADDTILLDIANDLVLFGALSYAAQHWNDKRADSFEARFVQILSDIQNQADDDELSGNAQVGQSFQYPDDLAGYDQTYSPYAVVL